MQSLLLRTSVSGLFAHRSCLQDAYLTSQKLYDTPTNTKSKDIAKMELLFEPDFIYSHRYDVETMTRSELWKMIP